MTTPRRSHVLALIGLAAGAAAALPIAATAGPGSQAPDLRADPVQQIEGPAVYADTGVYGAGRLLVRFEGYVTNIGQGPLEISGNPQAGGVRQRAWSASQGPGDLPADVVGNPEVVFEVADGHNHFHLKSAMRYSLWNLERTAQVAPGQKAGFCLYDIEDAPGPAPPQDPQEYTYDVTQFCDAGDPGSANLRMGTSAGWRDVYEKELAYQWVDVSGTAPGRYVVGSEADPENRIWEGGGAGEVNPPAFASNTVTVPGWTAQPVTVAQTPGPRTISLAASKFGTQSNSNLRYRIESAPSGGTLSVPVGVPISSGTPVTYTPIPGYGASDSFTFSALSTSSPFPSTPPISTVTIAGATPAVTISGVPPRLVANASAQLSAAVANLPGGVIWSASAGTISPTGLYRAPATPPRGGGAVTITAASAARPAVSAQAGIGISPTPGPTPRPGVAGRLSAGSKLLSRVAVAHVGRRVVIGKVATGAKRGTLRITATVKRTIVGGCAIGRIGARKTATCKITMKRPYPLKRVRITAKFTAVGGATAVRRAYVVR